MSGTVIAAALGEGVPVAGMSNFLHLTETAGRRRVFLGSSALIEKIAAAWAENTDLVGLSDRLTNEIGKHLVDDFAEAFDQLLNKSVRFAIGGTPLAAAWAFQVSFRSSQDHRIRWRPPRWSNPSGEIYLSTKGLFMPHNTKYTVIGAGHGGKAMAAHLALLGFPITLYNRTPERISAIKERQGIDLESSEGGPHGFEKLNCVTSSIAEALDQAEMIMVVVPSSAHSDVAKVCAPYLKDGQIVILHPGRTCGAIEFAKVLHDNHCTADVTVAEAETFIYASRSDGPAQAHVFRIKEAVPLAALPATRNCLVLDRIHEAYPQYIDGINVLQTGLNNMGAILHPTLAMLNAGWIEATHGDYQFYIDGVTPSVARVLEALDRERVTVASSLGIRGRTALEWLEMA